jgi:hypothetical protein
VKIASNLDLERRTGRFIVVDEHSGCGAAGRRIPNDCNIPNLRWEYVDLAILIPSLAGRHIRRKDFIRQRSKRINWLNLNCMRSRNLALNIDSFNLSFDWDSNAISAVNLV